MDLEFAEDLTLAAKPGERYAYSNAGYNLLAAIIGERSGEDFADYLNRALFNPAGMTSTFSQTDYQRKKNIDAHTYNEWTELTEFDDRLPSWHFFGRNTMIKDNLKNWRDRR